MDDKIANALDMRALDEVLEEPSNVVPYTAQVPEVYETDPYFDEACKDFDEVRDNMRRLISEATDMFDDSKSVAIRNQDPDSYNASARFLELAIRANRELLSTHRDIFAMKPPAPAQQGGQQAEQINNVFISASGSELLELLAAKGIAVKK